LGSLDVQALVCLLNRVLSLQTLDSGHFDRDRTGTINITADCPTGTINTAADPPPVHPEMDNEICEARVGSSRHVAWVLRVIRFGLDAAPCKRGLMTSRNVSQVGNYNSVRRFKIALQSGWQR
jgi:hypothetical protein